MNDTLVSEVDVTLSGRVSHTLGLYAVGSLPVTNQFNLFARAGYQQTTLDVELISSGTVAGLPFSAEAKDSVEYGGLGLGAGANLMITEDSGIRLEYTILSTEDLANDLEAAYNAAGFEADLSSYESINTAGVSYVTGF